MGGLNVGAHQNHTHKKFSKKKIKKILKNFFIKNNYLYLQYEKIY
jgi:hypothetical protein